MRRYRDLGVRLIGLSDRDADGLFDAKEPAHPSPRGEAVVAALNEAGVLIDVTHLSHPRKLEARGLAPSAVDGVLGGNVLRALD